MLVIKPFVLLEYEYLNQVGFFLCLEANARLYFAQMLTTKTTLTELPWILLSEMPEWYRSVLRRRSVAQPCLHINT